MTADPLPSHYLLVLLDVASLQIPVSSLKQTSVSFSGAFDYIAHCLKPLIRLLCLYFIAPIGLLKSVFMERVPFILLAQYFSILPDFNLVFLIQNYSYPLIVLHRVYTYFLRILKVFYRKTCMLHVQTLPNSDSGLALFPFLTLVLTAPLPTLTPHQSHYIHHHLPMFIRNVHKRCTNSGITQNTSKDLGLENVCQAR